MLCTEKHQISGKFGQFTPEQKVSEQAMAGILQDTTCISFGPIYFRKLAILSVVSWSDD